MVTRDIAKQAFAINNFELAADIYERTIKANGPSSDLYFGLADSFSRSGQFHRAFESYSCAFRLTTSINPNVLNHLVTSLVDAVKQVTAYVVMNKNNMFTCVVCRGLLNDPVTITCGHSFCRKCIEKDQTKTCKKCGAAYYFLDVSTIKTNVLLTRVLKMWFPSEYKATNLRTNGNVHFQQKDFQQAISFYSEAILIVPNNDHLSLSNRSHAYASLDNNRAALLDAELVIKLRPEWPKGYFRKGCALYGLEQYGDAVVALLQCLALDTSVHIARKYLSNALSKTLSPSTNPKSDTLCSQLSPAMLHRLISSNFSSALLQSDIPKLKNIISNTVTKATNFAITNLEHMHKFDKGVLVARPGTSASSEGYCPSTGQRIQERCSSSPNRGTASPDMAMEQSRSQLLPYSDVSRKRTRHILDTAVSQEARLKLQKKNPDIPLEALVIRPELLHLEDFECSLCFRLLYEPVTTPCGHVFCRSCLDRCLDHQTRCPICRGCLAEYLAKRRHTVTESIVDILETYFVEELRKRKILHEEKINEMSKMVSDKQEIPIFVCTMGYPGIQCPLLINEPRYRLMIRQCMESGTRQFGMCRPVGENGDDFSVYGCILEIRHIQFFHDGSSVLDTTGGKRFRVISKGHKDGYNTAVVEFLVDTDISQEDLPAIQQLQQEVYTMAKTWIDSLTSSHMEKILTHIRKFPAMEVDFQTYGSTWVWWMLSVLPVDPRILVSILAMQSFWDRLKSIQRVLFYINRQSR